ncbi:MAG: methylisocitrate lyase [Planctomycetales bacterium]
MLGPSPGKLFRDAAARDVLAIPGAFNALAARMAEQAGFPAVYLSGAAFSAGALGLPDVGLFTLTELAEQARRLTNSVDIPLIVDADVGFGEAINVERTVRELESAGAAAIQLEDQQSPKRCGHLSGKTLVSSDEMQEKVRAAAEARRDPDLVIIARTDARGVIGFDEAARRANQYLEAGADWIFPEALADASEFKRFAEAVKAPLLANMTEFGKSTLLSVRELGELGYAGVLFPVTLLRAAMKAVETCLQEIKSQGTQRELLSAMQTRRELYDVLGYDEILRRDEQRFQGPSDTS